MQRTEELAIIETILGRLEGREGRSWFNSEELQNLSDITEAEGRLYTDPDFFHAEVERIFNRLPLAVGFSGELKAGEYLRRQLLDNDILLTRSKSGEVFAFHNTCKHRAAKLCSKRSGNKLVCPYHSWSYSMEGRRVALPDGDGFDDGEVRLDSIPAVEHRGIIWLQLGQGELSAESIDGFIGAELAGELDRMDLAGQKLLAVTEKERPVNWKLAVEGGLENYHFNTVHGGSVGPQFSEQASGLKLIGEHIRFVTPRRTIGRLKETPPERQRLRSHAFITYLLMPNLNIFLERRHIAIHLVLPLTTTSCNMLNISLVPADTKVDSKAGEYFKEAHRHTDIVLDEDYTIHAGQQESLNRRPETKMVFGKQEGGIKIFHHWLQRLMDN